MNMAGDINTRMGVSGLSQYKSAMQQAQQSVKTLDAELKKNEAAYKASGDKETYMAEKSTLLNKKLTEQKKAADQAQKALNDMNKRGVDPASKAYQQMQMALVKAQTGVLETTASLNDLTRGEQQAAAGADQLTASVGNISKKVSLDAVVSGIDKLTTGLENAAKRAVDFGKAMVNEVLDSASWADDVATMASKLNMGVEEYQRYKGVFDTVADITVSDWIKAKKKIQAAINNPSQNQLDVLDALGISTHETVNSGKYGLVEGAARNYEDVLWEIGEKLRQKVESGELTQDLADTYANQVFGRSFDNLNPLFALGKEGFQKAFDKVNVVDEEAVQKLAEMNDTIIKLKDSFKKLEAEVLSGLAPTITDMAKALDGLMGKIIEYLKTEDGQKMLQKLGDAVSGLIGDLSKIDPDTVVQGFVDIFDSIVKSIEYLVDHRGEIVTALKAIFGVWATGKIVGAATTILNMVNAVKNFKMPTPGTDGGAPVTDGNGTGTGTGTSGGGWLSQMLNTLVSGMPTKAVLDDTFELLRRGKEQLAEYRKATQGMNATDANAYTLKMGFGISDEEAKDLANKMNKNPPEVTVETVPEANAAEKIAQDVGKVILPAELRIMGGGIGLGGGGEMLSLFSGNKRAVYSNANGINFVPYDGYLSVLHKGERVMPASQNKNYTYNNHTYFGSVNLHNGLEVDALTESIERNNRRKRGGYGAN